MTMKNDQLLAASEITAGESTPTRVEEHKTVGLDSAACPIPAWLMAQTRADVEQLSRAVSGLERALRNVSTGLCAARRALKRIDQDVRYARDFIQGTVQR